MSEERLEDDEFIVGCYGYLSRQHQWNVFEGESAQKTAAQTGSIPLTETY